MALEVSWSAGVVGSSRRRTPSRRRRRADALDLRPWSAGASNSLRWSPDGSTLAAVSGSRTRVFDARHGVRLRRLSASRHNHFQVAAFAGNQLILVRHDFTRGTSRVTSVQVRAARAVERTVFAGRGSVLDVTPSPDDRMVLLGQRSRDEWQFQPLSGAARVRRVHGVTRRLNPQATGRWAFPTTRGWIARS
jgi:hypothetical protein